jgi:hypothetical protein
MPEKVERCVKEVMQKQGVSESRAWAICNAAIDGFTLDKINKVNTYIDEVTGFLTAPVVLSRTGIQYYFGYELGIQDRASEKIGVYRPLEEVRNIDSVNTFVNLVVTDDHPLGPITVDNVKELQKGSASDIKFKDGVLTGVITITDKDLISKIKDGKIEVSVGYSQELVEEKGVYDGEAYEFKQTNIRANHLAVVGTGRCGPTCKITIDHKKEQNMIVIIDGIEFVVDNPQLAQAIKKMQDTYKSTILAKDQEMEKKEEEMEELKKEKDKAQAKSDALQKDHLNDEEINKLVHERASLLAQAREILGDKMPTCDCPREIKIAVIDSVYSGIDVKDKSDDYISAFFDMSISKAKDVKDKLGNLGDGFINKDKDNITPRDKYMRDQLGLEVR